MLNAILQPSARLAYEAPSIIIPQNYYLFKINQVRAAAKDRVRSPI